MNITFKKSENGYTLLFAVLTAALVLGVAVFIVSIATKQFELSASVRNSMYSFYAADSGMECASLAFANNTLATTTSASMPCGGVTPTGAFVIVSSTAPDVPTVLNGSSYPVYKANVNVNFAYLSPTTGFMCANVFIYDGYSTTGLHYTVIDSRGYNHCGSATKLPDTAVPNTVERAIRLSKQG